MSLYQLFEIYFPLIEQHLASEEYAGKSVEFPTYTDQGYTVFRFPVAQFEKYKLLRDSPLYKALK